MTRVSMARTSICVPTAIRLVIGSMTTTSGSNILDGVVHLQQVGLEAVRDRPVGVELQQALVHPALQVDARRAHVADHLLRRFLEQEVQAFLAARAGRVDEMRRERGLAGAGGAREEHGAGAVEALAAEHLVERGRPVETRSVGASCSSSSEVTGSTVMPSRSMRNGYSLVPWCEPRYFTTRMRRVEICSCTRWSSEITASVMYSSSPWRVSCSRRVSAVMTAVMSRSRSQRNSRRSSARRMPVSLRPPNRVSMRVEHDALGADLLDGVFEPHEQAFEVVFAGLLDLAAIDVDVVDEQLLLVDELVEVVAERAHVLRELLGVLLEGHQHAGFAELGAPFTRKRDAQQRLARTRGRRKPAWAGRREARRW